jgi:cell division protein FtsL
MANFLKKAVTATTLIFKSGEIIVKVDNVADSVRVLRQNVAEKVKKYQTQNSDLSQDMKSLLRDLDRVTDNIADVAGTVGLKPVEENLRKWIKPEMYD